MKTKLTAILLLVASVALVQADTITQTANRAGSFKTLVAALKATGLDRTLNGGGPFTVFAPTDEAFSKLPAGTVEALIRPENRERLAAILTYHVVPGEILAANVARLKDRASIKTVNGQSLTFRKDGLRLNQSRITQTDILCDNGVIHVIDSVLIPKDLPDLQESVAPGTKDLIGTAKAAGQFKTLLAAIDAAGLKHDLMGEGPFTVFAPTDEAFAKLGHTVNDLLRPENRDKLRTILKYHVVSGEILAANVVRLKNGTDVRTLAHQTIRVTNSGRLAVNDAYIIKTDVLATNGVIHVIDKVLIPR